MRHSPIGLNYPLKETRIQSGLTLFYSPAECVEEAGTPTAKVLTENADWNS
jgi:hypothetical protein